MNLGPVELFSAELYPLDKVILFYENFKVNFFFGGGGGSGLILGLLFRDQKMGCAEVKLT